MHKLCGVILSLLLLAVLSGCGGDGTLSPKAPEKIFGDQGLGPGQFVYPRALAVAPDGAVFAVDKYARIQRFKPDGTFEICWQMPEWLSGKPTGLGVDAAGRLFVADTHYHRVVVFDRDGKELARFGSMGQELGQFIFPTDVAVDGEGSIYVSEYGGNDRITRFTPDFKPVASFGGLKSGDEELLRPQSIAFDAQWDLWVADACHHRVCRFSREGKLLNQFGTMGTAPGQLQYPYGIAPRPDGTLLVCEFGNARVQQFDRSGKSLGCWGSPGREPGQLCAPWAVGIGGNGYVYVLDSGNNRVQMIKM